VTDQSSLPASPYVNLTVPPTSESLAGAPQPDPLPQPGAELAPSWVVCQICGRRGRWVNPFPEVQHDF
jgi:hypothetical protein